MRIILAISLALCLSGCTMFKRTVLVPTPVMPTPPGVLMQPPKELKTIKDGVPPTTKQEVPPVKPTP